MLYQLPNGKVIYLTVSEYLDLTDRELHELVHSGYGSEPPNFTKMHYGGKETEEIELSKPIDEDFLPEEDDIDLSPPIDLNNLPEDI